jgi:hypothetical protein
MTLINLHRFKAILDHLGNNANLSFFIFILFLFFVVCVLCIMFQNISIFLYLMHFLILLSSIFNFIFSGYYNIVPIGRPSFQQPLQYLRAKKHTSAGQPCVNVLSD